LPLPPPPPRLHASPYATPDAAAARNRLHGVESPPPPELWRLPMGSPIAAAYDGGLLPSLSVANFRKYQDVALSVRLSLPLSLSSTITLPRQIVLVLSSRYSLQADRV